MANPRIEGTNAPRDCSNARTIFAAGGLPPASIGSRPSQWRRRWSAGVRNKIRKSRHGRLRPQRLCGYFAFSAASFLHAERNFLRSLPLSPFSSASLEHSSEPAVRGFCGLLFRRRLGFGLRSPRSCSRRRGLRGRGAHQQKRSNAVAVTREEIFVMRHLGLKTRARPSRRDAEPRVNEAGYRSRRHNILNGRSRLRCRKLGCVRMRAGETPE